MKKPQIPDNEVERLKNLQSHQLLDDLPDEDYDLITKLASDICGTSISFVTLIDSKKQVFKSSQGLDLKETSRDISFCAHAINTPKRSLIVNDVTLDERFKENPLVTEDPKIAFYAGIPLMSKEGYALGTLCILDHKPKVLSTSQLKALKSLAKLVERLFESRKKSLELEKVYSQLEVQKTQTEEIAYSIAHDLKNPLDNIQGFLELLQNDTGTSLGEEAVRYINYATQSTYKMTGLIYEILAFAKLTSQKNTIERVDVEPIIKNIVDLNLPIIKSNSIAITYSKLPKIYTSKSTFSLVLRNLIGNAIKYRSKVKPLVIKIKIKNESDRWVIHISDNGLGIKESNLDKIFKPFYKEDSQSDDGVGMGLAVCKKTILNLGGDIWVTSEHGNGSTFSFNLPKQNL
jgi:signal transduction histidine kinase